MADVLVATEDLTVLGGPLKRDVNVGFGSAGPRGSQIFVGLGKPTAVGALQQTPQVFDMYINLLSSDDEYLFLYQYINQDGANVWTRLLRLIPNVFLTNPTGNFVDGEARFAIPVISVVPLVAVPNIAAINFNVQHTVINDNPVASSITVENLSVQGTTVVLPIVIRAASFSGGNWSNLSGQNVVQFLITAI